jgi:hypothetical protein
MSDIQSMPGLTPKRDDQFAALLQSAITGLVPVYLAAVPLALCIPYDPDYRPDLHEVGAEAISKLTGEGRQGQLQNLFVYQRGKWFVVSDDYIALFAALNGLPDYVPCWVLGKPEGDLVQDVQGPIAPSDVARLLGMS